MSTIRSVTHLGMRVRVNPMLELAACFRRRRRAPAAGRCGDEPDTHARRHKGVQPCPKHLKVRLKLTGTSGLPGEPSAPVSAHLLRSDPAIISGPFEGGLKNGRWVLANGCSDKWKNQGDTRHIVYNSRLQNGLLSGIQLYGRRGDHGVHVAWKV